MSRVGEELAAFADAAGEDVRLRGGDPEFVNSAAHPPVTVRSRRLVGTISDDGFWMAAMTTIPAALPLETRSASISARTRHRPPIAPATNLTNPTNACVTHRSSIGAAHRPLGTGRISGGCSATSAILRRSPTSSV